MDDSISCCGLQNNKDLLTMVSSGGKLKTDSSAWVLMWVYYQIEIPYPVSHIKSGKTGFEWIWGVLSQNFISCCAIQQRKTKQENETNHLTVIYINKNAGQFDPSPPPLKWIVG